MIEVKLHDIGEGMTQAGVLAFFVKPGDIVKPDEPLVEVQTDKMTAEIPAPSAGTIKEIKVEVGQTIPVGTTIFLLEAESDKKQEPIRTTVKSNTEKFTIRNDAKKRIKATPFTRKIARENGVNMESIKGTGPAGRITDEDVKSYIARRNQPLPNHVQVKKEVAPFMETLASCSAIETKQSKLLPFSGRRKQIAAKMSQSLLTIPHCTHFEEIDLSNILEMRELWKKKKISVSATALFVKAISIALKDFPIFNARLREDEGTIELLENHHIGIATDTEEGLIVPVVRNVESKSLKEIHQDIKELTTKAQANKLSVSEITGGSFTISNVGPFGGSIGATPIINHPEVGLISFHKTKKRPVVNEYDEIVIRSMMNISMSFDHRVADGATAVAFTNRLAEILEEPKLLLLELV